MTKSEWGAIIALGALILAFLYYSGYFEEALILPAQQSGDSVCPNYVFNTFSLIFRNTGKTGTNLFVKVWSNNINFTKIETSVYLPIEQAKLEFIPKTNSFPSSTSTSQNVTIHILYKYKKNNFKGEVSNRIDCEYIKNMGDISLSLRKKITE